jgi:predicted ester cyclase
MSTWAETRRDQMLSALDATLPGVQDQLIQAIADRDELTARLADTEATQGVILDILDALTGATS